MLKNNWKTLQRLKKVCICRALFLINLHTSKFKYIDYVVTMLVIRFFLKLQSRYKGKNQGEEREGEERKREAVLKKFV